MRAAAARFRICLLPVYVLEGMPAGKGLDSTDSCGDAGFLEDYKDAQVSGPVRVRTAAKLAAEARNFNQPDAVSIFFFKKRHSPGFQGFLQPHYPNVEMVVLTNFIVYQPLDPGKFFGGDGGEVGKVEPEAIRGDE